MFKFKKIAVAVFLTSALVACDRQEASQATAPALDDHSYAVGALLGTHLHGIIQAQKGVIEYDQEKLIAGARDVLSGKVDLAQNQALQATLQGLEAKLEQAKQKKLMETTAKTKAEGEQFRAEFATQAGVQQTASGLLYRIEKAGEGVAIKATDRVKVHYTGKLINGTVFDSSVQRGQPAEFRLDQVIAGWTEGLQLVKKGGKMTLVIPPELAYGDQGVGELITPNATLVFDVEVLDVNP